MADRCRDRMLVGLRLPGIQDGASAPSVSPVFKGLPRTVETESFRPAPAPASAAPPTVRMVASLKALALLPLGGIADDADGADGCAPL